MCVCRTELCIAASLSLFLAIYEHVRCLRQYVFSSISAIIFRAAAVCGPCCVSVVRAAVCAVRAAVLPWFVLLCWRELPSSSCSAQGKQPVSEQELILSELS
jgi:hypothetical protein